MNILFCGTNVPDEIEYNSRMISAAGNRYQNNAISCLKDMGNIVENLAFVYMSAEDSLPTNTVRTSEKDSDICTDSYNMVQLKDRSMSSRMKAVKKFHRQVRKSVKEADIIMSYNVHYAWLDLPGEARRQGKKSAVFLADYSGPECFTSPVRKIYAQKMLDVMRRYDIVIGLSPNIEKYLKKGQKFILLEGGIDEKMFESFDKDAVEKKNEAVEFMYSGLLSHVTGVDMLLEAMKIISDRNIRLMITGKGDLEDKVKNVAQADSRIVYAGHLEYDDYLKMLQQADVLVNPRNMDLPENQNNFPSKIMDYLASGKRIVSTRFAGYEKFSDCIEYMDSSPESLAYAMNKISEEIVKTSVEQRQQAENERFRYNRRFAEQFLWKNELQEVLNECK